MEAQDVGSGSGLDFPATHGQSKRKIFWVAQEGGSGAPPLTFVLAGYGDAWVAQGLARALEQEQTVYCLQPPDEGTPKTARELAVLYVEHLRAAQPRGPYCLGGYSAGALMALEIAVQLHTRGEQVGVVALLDPMFMRYTRFERACYIGLQRICGFVGKIYPGKIRVLKILQAMFDDKGLDTHLEALAGHRPQRYPGDIVFYRGRWSVGHSPLLVRQIKWFTGARLKVESVPGDHHTFIRPPHVTELARRLRAELQRASAGAPAQ
jgi:Thioesterase domain